MALLNIAKDYSPFTGLRHCSTSENSGEDFYHKILNIRFKEAIDKKEELTIILDGVDGFAPSFLDEAFGNLVYDFGLEQVKTHIKLISTLEPHWSEMICKQTYPDWENRRLKTQEPRKTAEHDPWYRIVDGALKCEIWNC